MKQIGARPTFLKDKFLRSFANFRIGIRPISVLFKQKSDRRHVEKRFILDDEGDRSVTAWEYSLGSQLFGIVLSFTSKNAQR